MTFDPTKKYPVIENIYAGPQGSFVPKTFSTQLGMQTLAELGFIVVQIDGMGTAQPVEGVPRRRVEEPRRRRLPGPHPLAQGGGGEVPVLRRHARRYLRHVGRRPERDGRACCSTPSSTRPRRRHPAATTTGWTRSGGTSSGWGGRSAPQYAASSNMEHAGKLQGRLLLIYGEMDTNVDPSSTMQVVNTLILANKDFELRGDPERRAHGRWRLRRPQAVRLLRAVPARASSRRRGARWLRRPRRPLFQERAPSTRPRSRGSPPRPGADGWRVWRGRVELSDCRRDDDKIVIQRRGATADYDSVIVTAHDP